MLGNFKRKVIYLFTFLTSGLFASPQRPDYLIYQGDTVATYNLLLELYLQSKDTVESEKLFGLSFRDGASFSCWRGYQAIYSLLNDSLFLVDITRCGELQEGMIDKANSLQRIRSIFGNRVNNNMVYIDWFDGCINFPLTDVVLRWDGVFNRIYEREKVITIFNGLVVNTKDVDNYIDDPKRINRRNKYKVADLLFKKLRKVNFRNSNEFNCSDEYLVAIDQFGNVTKVRSYYFDGNFEDDPELADVKYCTDKIFNAFRDMKFDVILDKGEAISEEIYISIRMRDNGKLENQTTY